MGTQVGHDPVDLAIQRIADRQYGVISRAQLQSLPLNAGPSFTGSMKAGSVRCTAACTRSSGRASSQSTGTGWPLCSPAVRKSRKGINLHWADLPDDEATTHHGIPTTTVPRTLLDISAVVQRDELRGAMRQAEQLRLTDPLWVVQEAQRGLNVVKQELEERFQAFLLNAGLPLPNTNVLIEEFEVDCVWPAVRLIIELDSRTHHAIAQPLKPTALATAASKLRAGA